MKTVKTSDWYISENKAGGAKYWRVEIVSDGDNYYTQASWYQISKTGRETKMQTSEKYFAAPTNVGRANERDSKAQAEFEYDAIIKKQRDKGYRLPNEAKQARPMPMLAHKFTDHKGKVEFPVYVQPKLNGMRMLFDGKEGWSRGNKEVIPEVIQHLQFDVGGCILDGELMLPNNVLLQESMKAIKKFRPELSPELLYHVYDIVEDADFATRNDLIKRLMPLFPLNVVYVQSYLCHNETDVMKYHKMFTKAGYEGTMIRDPNGEYEIGKRSYSLLKLKDFRDEEYRILDVVDGDGSDKGLAIFVLGAGNGQTFNCRPEGTQENRAELYRNRKKLINEFLTVRYQELSRDGVPIFPVGVAIRSWGEF